MNDYYVSVIVPVYNRANEINRCLDALINQTYPEELFEIIVVDDYSTDDLKAAVKKYPKAKYVLNELEFSLPAARNMGLREANGIIILFLDDDTIVERDFIDNIVKVFENNENVGGVTGLQRNVMVQSIKKGIFGKLMYFYAKFFGISGFFANQKGVGKVLQTGFIVANFDEVDSLTEVEWLSGCNMAYSRKAIDDTGLFDPKYDGHSYHEDSDFSYRVFKKGYKLQATPDAAVEHLVSSVARVKLGRIKYYQLIHNDRFFIKNIYDGSKIRYIRHLIAHLALFLPVFSYSLIDRNLQLFINYLKAEKTVLSRVFTGLED
jgi:GT2 family glycosyltransferase